MYMLMKCDFSFEPEILFLSSESQLIISLAAAIIRKYQCKEKKAKHIEAKKLLLDYCGFYIKQIYNIKKKSLPIFAQINYSNISYECCPLLETSWNDNSNMDPITEEKNHQQ